MNSTKKDNSSFIIFLITACIYAAGNFIWWRNNTPIIPILDSAVHFTDIFLSGFFFQNAPLLTWIMRVMFFIFGKEYYDLIVIVVNYVFFLIPLYYIYKIGTELKDKETGNIAMILFALVPAVYGMSREYGHQDYHIIAGITFNIYCLIKTDYFRDRKWSIWYGVSVGLGLMIKDTFLAYFFVPFMYIAIKGLKEKADRAKAINICISVILGSLIAGWHYFRYDIIKKILGEPTKEIYSSLFSFESLRVMTIGLWEELLSPPIFIIFVIGLIYFILKYKGKYKNIILLWFFIPWLIIMLMPHRKLSEYGAGFIPAMVLIGAVFISYINKSYIKKTGILLLIVIGLLQYVDFSNFLNIKFFNIHCRFKEYEVLYYEKYTNLSTCNGQEATKFILKLINHLKNKNYRDFILINSLSLEQALIISYMAFNDMSCIRWNDSINDDELRSKIFINIGSQKTVIEITDSQIEQYMQDSLNRRYITEEFKKELFEKNKYVFNEIAKNYHIIDVFYLGDIECEDTKVILFGRKEKFPVFLE